MVNQIKTAWGSVKGGLGEVIKRTNTRDAIEVILCGAILAGVGGVWQLKADVSAIKATIETADPKAMAKQVNELAKEALTREDVRLLIAADEWRRRVELHLNRCKCGEDGLQTIWSKNNQPSGWSPNDQVQNDGSRVLPGLDFSSRGPGR